MKMKNKIIVWDLFGGLNGSVEKAIGTKKYDIYTLDILEKTKDGKENIVTNLANEDINKLFKQLNKLPKPDIIVSSPMCMSFSRASSMKEGSTGWIVTKDNSIKLRPKKHFEDKEYNWAVRNGKGYWRYDFKRSIFNAKLGAKAIENTIEIIKKFKPNFWYIENPAGSLMWNYIEHNLHFDKGYKNLVHYGAYNAPSKKPTIFLSNISMNLKKVEKGYKSEIKWENIKRKDRSDIPALLIKDIFKQFNKYE